MNKKTVLTVFVIIIVLTVTFFLLFTESQKRYTTTSENSDTKNRTIENESTSISNLLIADTLKETPMVRIVQHDDENMENTITNKMITQEVVHVDSDIVVMTEYVQIALTEAKKVMKIPDDIVPTIEVQDETIIVTFPWRPPEPPPEGYLVAGPDYFARVTIDIKTKAVIKMSVAS